MKIEKIEIRYLESKLDKSFAWSQRWTDIRNLIVIKVFTDDGIIGWGETFGSQENVKAISTILKLSIGEDPRKFGMIWNKLYRATFQGHVYAKSAVYAISALDTALLDLPIFSGSCFSNNIGSSPTIASLAVLVLKASAIPL